MIAAAARGSLLAAIAWLAAAPAVAPFERRSVLTADLPAAVAAAIRPDANDPAAILDSIVKNSGVEAIDLDRVRLTPDLRWFLAEPPAVTGGPFLELRRWPGDSVIALYAVAGAATPGRAPPIAGSEPASDAAEAGRWSGTIPTSGGRRGAVWIEVAVADRDARLGLLLIPGDAGLGVDAVSVLLEEMIALARRIAVRPEAWDEGGLVPAGASISLPRLLAPPTRVDEIHDVWQSLQAGGFSFGLPPGLRAVQLTKDLQAPNPVEQAVLWFRGQFQDRAGAKVVVGDGTRAGYVSIVAPVDAAWKNSTRKPLAAANATRVAVEDFSDACDSTGASAARAERWTEPGFAGDWLIFRLLFGDQGIEIGMPVLAGRQSEALFWMPVTVRPPGFAPAPPPMDPAARFGIAYRPLTKIEKAEQPWMEGVLTVPGLRVEIPLGWWAIANLRSADGFPVLFFADGGRTMGRLLKHPAGSPPVGAEGLQGWAVVKKPTKKSLEAAYSRGKTERIYITDRGDGLQFEPDAGVGEGWERMIETATTLRQSGREGARGKDSRE